MSVKRGHIRSFLVLLSIGAGSGGNPGSDQCCNPLFIDHWFNKEDHDSQSMNAVPTIRTNLRLCPAYNGRQSCCRQSFEHEQLVHFNFWKQIFASKLERITKNRDGVKAVRQLEKFNSATEEDRAEYDRVLAKYDEVLDPGGHSTCLSALSTYVAGMICFACETDWPSFVHRDYGKIVRVLLTSSTCTEIWLRCANFGELTRTLSQVSLDSSLAAMQSTGLENLEMFYDQQGLCDWMHSSVAMHPFTTPTEMQREAAPVPSQISASKRRLQVAEGFDAMRAGKASGFDITWGGLTGGAASRASSTLVLVAATMVATVVWRA